VTFSADIESRIRALCAQAVVAEGEELHDILAQLKSALREHMAMTREIVVASYPNRVTRSTPKGPKIA
jgi:hypothetical protein